MRKAVLFGLVIALAVPTMAATLWDNGDTDGSNGYSNSTQAPFGFRRQLLDDFVVPSGPGWRLQDLHTYQIWNTFPPGSGVDFQLNIRTDNAGTPGTVIHTAVSQNYSETPTGRVWFGRQEYEMDYQFQDIVLAPGTYWIEGNVDGPENNFWMIRGGITGSAAWANYEDLGYGPTSQILSGTPPVDLSFRLTGEVVPEPATLSLLGLAGLFLARRR